MNKVGRRRDRIVELMKEGEADVETLAVTLGVSTSTVRRDLSLLSRSGVVARTYGGAILAHAALEQTLSVRERTNAAQKEAIARAAADLIEDGDVVLLDAGSTVAALGRLLVERKVRVVTSNLPLVPLLVSRGIEVTILGGTVRPISMGLVGALAEITLQRLSVDKAFLSADGVVARRGLCEARPEQSRLKELMMAQAGAVFVLADASKLGRASQQYWAPLPAHWTLVTDAPSDDERLIPFRRLHLLRIVCSSAADTTRAVTRRA